MATQFEGFKTVLKDPELGYNLSPADDEIPLFTSRYTAKTLADVCTWQPDYAFCSDLP
jgi:hypothetical protein